MTGPGEVVLDIPANSAMVGTARLLVACLAARRELTADRVDDLKLAVSEACSNAIEASGAASLGEGTPGREAPGHRVSVAWAEDDDGVQLWVSDEGRGTDLDDSAARALDPPGAIPADSASLGVSLIRALVDSSEFTSGPSGTTVRLTMCCPRAGAEGY